jgi:hypothetical protein
MINIQNKFKFFLIFILLYSTIVYIGGQLIFNECNSDIIYSQYITIILFTYIFYKLKKVSVNRKLYKFNNKSINNIYYSLIAIKIIILIIIIYKIGLNEWYSGKYLADKIDHYSVNNTVLILLDLIALITTPPLVACAALKLDSILYSRTEYIQKKKLIYNYLLVFILIPLLFMSRSSLFLGLIVGLYLFNISVIKSKKIILLISIIITSVVIGLGSLRSEQLGQETLIHEYLISEASPYLALCYIEENFDNLNVGQ